MTVEEIKSTRTQIDGISKLIEQLPPSREVSLARTSAQLAKMWLGKVLQAMEVANPYPESKNPGSQKIEPTADTGDDFLKACMQVMVDGEMNTVSKLKFIRKRIDDVLPKLEWNKAYNDGYSEWKKDEEIILASRLSKQYLVEAGMWLGMELGSQRNEQIEKYTS